MPTAGDLQNLVLARMRTQGVNFGGAPTNSTTSPFPPYQILLLLNEGYNEFLARTALSPLAAVQVQTPTVLNAQSVPLAPVPANGLTVNPALMRVYELTYTQTGGGQTYYVPIISTDRFRAWTGGYTRRLGNYGPWPKVAAQLFGKNQLDLWPGTAVAGDVFNITGCPDPMNSPANCPASNGGQLVNTTDVPLIPAQFHGALVEYAVAQLSDQKNTQGQQQTAQARFEKYVDDANQFSAARGEGDPEMRVVDRWLVAGYWP